MKRRIIIPLFIASILLNFGCSSPKSVTDEELAKIKSTVGEWAKVFNARNWDQLSGFYSTTTILNEKRMTKGALQNTIKNFMKGNPDYFVTLLPETWAPSLVQGDTVVGWLSAESRWNGLDQVNKLRIRLILYAGENEKNKILYQQEDFYNDRNQLSTANENYQNRMKGPLLEDGSPNSYYWSETFDSIRKANPSVLWFAYYDSKPLYWFFHGNKPEPGHPYSYWLQEMDGQTTQMGILDKDGKIIIPAEFDYVRNIGGTIPGLIEVEKGGLLGLYKPNGEIFLPVEYASIYPLHNDPYNRIAWVEKGGKIFAINSEGVEVNIEPESNRTSGKSQFDFSKYLTDFPWEVYDNNQMLHSEPTLLFAVAEAWRSYSNKFFFTPQFINLLGILPDMQFGSYEYDRSSTGFMKVDSVINFEGGSSGILATLENWGVGGRESYHEEELRLVNYNSKGKIITRRDTLGRSLSYRNNCFNFNYNFISSDLVEVVTLNSLYSNASQLSGYISLPQYFYFRIHPNGELEKLKTNRLFAQTKFKQITAEDFKGCIAKYVDSVYVASKKPDLKIDYPGEEFLSERKHLSIEELEIMVNEIYADYGYKFTNAKWKKYFSEKKWYEPRFDNVESMLTEMDKNNIQFIREYISQMKGQEEKYLQEEIEIASNY